MPRRFLRILLTVSGPLLLASAADAGHAPAVRDAEEAEVLKQLPEGSGDIQMERLSIAGLSFKDVRARFAVKPASGALDDRWVFTNVKAKLYGGRAEARRIELYRTKAGNLGVRIEHLQVMEGNLARLIADQNQKKAAVAVSGTFRLTLNLDYSGRDMSGDMLLTVKDGRLAAMPGYLRLLRPLNFYFFQSSDLTRGVFKARITKRGFQFTHAEMMNRSGSIRVYALPGGWITHSLHFEGMILVLEDSAGSFIAGMPIVGRIYKWLFHMAESLVLRFRLTGSLSDPDLSWAPFSRVPRN